MQRCGVAPLSVSAVDVFWGAEFLHSGKAALLGSVQQGGVPPQQVLDVCVSVFHHVQRNVAISVLLGRVRSVLTDSLNYFIEPFKTQHDLFQTTITPPHFEKQLADLIFPFGCSLVKWGELPQVRHVH